MVTFCEFVLPNVSSLLLLHISWRDSLKPPDAGRDAIPLQIPVVHQSIAICPFWLFYVDGYTQQIRGRIPIRRISVSKRSARSLILASILEPIVRREEAACVSACSQDAVAVERTSDTAPPFHDPQAYIGIALSQKCVHLSAGCYDIFHGSL